MVDPRLLVREQGFAGYLTDFKRRVRGGELGSLPVILGLIIIAVIFQSLNDDFLSAGSLSDIGVYIAGTGIMATGIVFVLLLGEIDLSVGSVAGVGAAVWAVLSVTHGVNDWLAVLIAIAAGLGHRRPARLLLRQGGRARLRRHPGRLPRLERSADLDDGQRGQHQHPRAAASSRT